MTNEETRVVVTMTADEARRFQRALVATIGRPTTTGDTAVSLGELLYLVTNEMISADVDPTDDAS